MKNQKQKPPFEAKKVVDYLYSILPDYRQEKYLDNVQFKIVTWWKFEDNKNKMTKVCINDETDQISGPNKEIERKIIEILVMSSRMRRKLQDKIIFLCRVDNGNIYIRYTETNVMIKKFKVQKNDNKFNPKHNFNKKVNRF